MTRAIIDTAKPLGIAMHDHIITGHNCHATAKAKKLIYAASDFFSGSSPLSAGINPRRSYTIQCYPIISVVITPLLRRADVQRQIGEMRLIPS